MRRRYNNRLSAAFTRDAAYHLLTFAGEDLAAWIGLASQMPEPLYSVPHWRELPYKAVQLAGVLAHEQAVVEAESREAMERDKPPQSKPPHKVMEAPRMPRRWRGGR